MINVGLGFAVQSFLAYQLGLGSSADAFQAAAAIVTFCAVIAATLTQSFLVPVVAAGGRPWLAARPILAFSAAGSLLLVGLAAVNHGDAVGEVLLGASAAPMLAALCAPPTAAALAERRHFLAASGGAANGLGLFGALLVIPQSHGLFLGAALSAGYLVQACVLIGLTHRRLRSGAAEPIAWATFVGVFSFTALAKTQPLAERALAALGETGALAALGYGQKLVQGLQLVASFGLAAVVTTTVARQLARGRKDEAGALVGRAIVLVFALGTVVSAVYSPAVPFSVSVVYSGLDDGGATRVAAVIWAQLPWVVFTCAASVVTGALYGLRIYKPVALASLAGIGALVLSWGILWPFYPNIAVAAGGSVGALSSLVVSSFLLRRTELWASIANGMAATRWMAGWASFIGVVSFAVTILVAPCSPLLQVAGVVVIALFSLVPLARANQRYDLVKTLKFRV